MDAAYVISKFIVHSRFEDLPEEVIQVAKKEVLDTLANAFGGSRDEGVRTLHDLIKYWGGREESTIIGYGTRVPAIHASLVNSTMAFTLDYDDVHERGRLHSGVVVVPTAFASAELKQAVSGKEFITALCLAVEFGDRLGIASKLTKPGFIMGGWDYAALHGFFTGAAVAGRLLNLDEQKMHHALGIAYHQAAGNGQSALDEADTKKMGPGFASRGGITSVLLAQRGMTGAKAIFDESDASLCHLYHAGCNKKALIEDLGQKFEMVDMSFKPYPCCRLGHAHIDAILKLIEDNKIGVEEVEEIIPTVCQFVYAQLCTPMEAKEKPGNVTAAQFSLPWVIACGVVRKKVGISEFSEEALGDRALLDVAAKVHPILDTSLPDHLAITTVKVKTKRGTFEVNTTDAYGSPQNPMTFEAIEEKLMDCASFSARTIPEENLNKIIWMVKNLEEVKNVEEITKFLY